LHFFSIGRLVFIKHKDVTWGWGCTINFLRKKVNVKGQGHHNQDNSDAKFLYIIDVMLHVKSRQNKGDKLEPADYNEEGEMEVVPMLLETVQEISTATLIMPNDLIKPESKQTVKEAFREVFAQFGAKIPKMDPIKDMKIQDPELAETLKRTEALNKKIDNLRGKITSNFEEQLEVYKKKMALEKQGKFLRGRIEQGGRMVLEEDLKSMKRIMRRLGLTNKDDMVQLKGRVAGEVSSCDELMITELVFSGFFNNLSPSEIAAIMSCMVHDESGAEKAKFILKNDVLALAFQRIQEQAKTLLEVYAECKLQVDETTYIGTFKPQLMDVTFKWCEGASFGEICKLTDTYEGSIIRCFRRLEEVLKELANAARVIENMDLHAKFNAASEKLKRGIVFAASLYIN
jgi:ATP-dependent RNA helicase DOB1